MKNEIIRLRITAREKELIKEYAELMGMNISDYIRYSALISPPREVIEQRARTKEE